MAANEIPDDLLGLDIGPGSVKRFTTLLSNAQTVFHESKPDRHGYLFVIEGSVDLNGQKLAQGDQARLVDLLRRDALRIGTFTLASGRTSHYYVDGRKVTLSAEGAALIGAGVLDRLAGLPV